jgi:diaminohydroxyphosphoribosylaminopyrimidine deaminase / 5-amino-6-(5-phosphoribosylamino)uracil reductase
MFGGGQSRWALWAVGHVLAVIEGKKVGGSHDASGSPLAGVCMQYATDQVLIDQAFAPRAPANCAAAYQPIVSADPRRPFVVAQLGQSLDGRIATRTGESRWINRDAALDHVHRLRALVDAVVVGVGTVLADDPMLNVRRVTGRHPARVVIDPRGRLPAHVRCLAEDGARRIVVRHAGRAAGSCAMAETIAVAGADDRICPREIVAALFARGLKRLLIEGGARTVSQFLDADAVDRLHVLVAPVIIGSGKAGLDLAPIDALSAAKRPDTEAYVLGGGEVLFDCNMRRREPANA